MLLIVLTVVVLSPWNELCVRVLLIFTRVSLMTMASVSIVIMIAYRGIGLMGLDARKGAIRLFVVIVMVLL